ERLWTTDEIHAGGINEKALDFDFRKFSMDLIDDIVPENHSIGLCVRFRNAGEFSLACSRRLERLSNDTFGTCTREYRALNGEFGVGATVFAAADIGVFSFGVLAVDDEIDVFLPSPDR